MGFSNISSKVLFFYVSYELGLSAQKLVNNLPIRIEEYINFCRIAYNDEKTLFLVLKT